MCCHRGSNQGSAFLLKHRLTFRISIQGGVLQSFISLSVDSDDSSYGRDSTLIMYVAGYEEETSIK